MTSRSLFYSKVRISIKTIKMVLIWFLFWNLGPYFQEIEVQKINLNKYASAKGVQADSSGPTQLVLILIEKVFIRSLFSV